MGIKDIKLVSPAPHHRDPGRESPPYLNPLPPSPGDITTYTNDISKRQAETHQRRQRERDDADANSIQFASWIWFFSLRQLQELCDIWLAQPPSIQEAIQDKVRHYLSPL